MISSSELRRETFILHMLMKHFETFTRKEERVILSVMSNSSELTKLVMSSGKMDQEGILRKENSQPHVSLSHQEKAPGLKKKLSTSQKKLSSQESNSFKPILELVGYL